MSTASSLLCLFEGISVNCSVDFDLDSKSEILVLPAIKYVVVKTSAS